MFKKTLLAAVVFGFASTTVQAYELFGQEVSGYVTSSVGQARASKPKSAKDMQSWWSQFGGLSSTSTDRTDTAYKIAVGLKINPYVALEAQYIDLGESSYKGGMHYSGRFIESLGSHKLKSETSGFGANLVGTLPLEDFTFFAKTGYHYLKTKSSNDYSFEAIIFNQSFPYSYSKNKTIRKWSPSFGAGVSYNITPEFSVLAEYERYYNVANKKVDVSGFGDKRSMKHNIDFASVGLRYNF